MWPGPPFAGRFTRPQCTGALWTRAWGEESPETELEGFRLSWTKGLSMMSGGRWCQTQDESILEKKCWVKQRGLPCSPSFCDDQGVPRRPAGLRGAASKWTEISPCPQGLATCELDPASPAAVTAGTLCKMCSREVVYVAWWQESGRLCGLCHWAGCQKPDTGFSTGGAGSRKRKGAPCVTP